VKVFLLAWNRRSLGGSVSWRQKMPKDVLFLVFSFFFLDKFIRTEYDVRNEMV
jgi:hypothetical protein